MKGSLIVSKQKQKILMIIKDSVHIRVINWIGKMKRETELEEEKEEEGEGEKGNEKGGKMREWEIILK